MILATSDSVPGKRITEVKGLVQGNTIRARNIGRDIVAGLRNIVGGEVTEYTRLMSESREQAIMRMVEQAESMGANAVVGMRFVTSMVMQGASELLSYGTAVVVEDEG
ncbi:MAG: YbjQ family protein [Chloroflexi bacterium]|nr:YbjQ family protein [Chloroflexota bacterium]MYA49340.1 YbjQ family protein [Chloroflexota bacterium]MYB85113.1 YbjQ family protein [Chloroflexota bacterium]MYK34971.1 YbjQ family protein [Chloroflexota bacterium]